MSVLTSLLIGKVAEGLIGKVNPPGEKQAPVTDAQVREMIREAVERAMQDPVVKNETNAEKLLQSRVVVGSSLSAVAAAMATLLALVYPDVDWQHISVAIVTLIGAGVALYGRLRPGLKPLFS